MKWLTIDTCTPFLSVGIADEGRVYGEVTFHLRRNHAERLLPVIDRMLKDTSMSLAEIDGVAVTYGPGSYTGVRVGVATAKTFAWSLRLPLVGVSSLQALAVNGKYFSDHVIPMFDARRDRVYSGHYRFNAVGQPETVRDDRVTDLYQWLEGLRRDEGRFLFLGDGANVYRTAIMEEFGSSALFAGAREHVVRPAAIAELADWKWQNEGGADVHRFAPRYLQVTEVEWK